MIFVVDVGSLYVCLHGHSSTSELCYCVSNVKLVCFSFFVFRFLFFVIRFSFFVIRFSFFVIRFSLFDFRFDIQNPILIFEIASNIIF